MHLLSAKFGHQSAFFHRGAGSACSDEVSTSICEMTALDIHQCYVTSDNISIGKTWYPFRNILVDTITRLGWISARQTPDSALGEDSRYHQENVSLIMELGCDLEQAGKARFHDAFKGDTKGSALNIQATGRYAQKAFAFSTSVPRLAWTKQISAHPQLNSPFSTHTFVGITNDRFFCHEGHFGLVCPHSIFIILN